MHCEKNIAEILLCTLLGEIDRPKSREDMQTQGIRSHLHLQPMQMVSVCIEPGRSTNISEDYTGFEVPNKLRWKLKQQDSKQQATGNENS